MKNNNTLFNGYKMNFIIKPNNLNELYILNLIKNELKSNKSLLEDCFLNSYIKIVYLVNENEIDAIQIGSLVNIIIKENNIINIESLKLWLNDIKNVIASKSEEYNINDNQLIHYELVLLSNDVGKKYIENIVDFTKKINLFEKYYNINDNKNLDIIVKTRSEPSGDIKLKSGYGPLCNKLRLDKLEYETMDYKISDINTSSKNIREMLDTINNNNDNLKGHIIILKTHNGIQHFIIFKLWYNDEYKYIYTKQLVSDMSIHFIDAISVTTYDTYYEYNYALGGYIQKFENGRCEVSKCMIKRNTSKTNELGSSITSFKTKTSVAKNINLGSLKIGSFDIETCNMDKDNIVVSACYSIFKDTPEIINIRKTGNIEYNSEYVNMKCNTIFKDISNKNIRYDYKSIGFIMLAKTIKELMLNYNKYVFYIHNLGGYDSIYIIAALIYYNNNTSDIKFTITPIKRGSKILSIIINFILTIDNKDYKYEVKFMDSYLFLPSSLKDLCKLFKLPSSKGLFPYKFLNNNLNYKGKIPSIDYYNITDNNEYMIEYNKYINKVYDIQEELIKYNKEDTLLLLYIMEYFKVEVAFSFGIDLIKCMTNTRLAINVFKDRYNESYNKIPRITYGQCYKFIKKAFFGGYTQVFIPKGENLKLYDINSHYPACAVNPMPTGDLIYTRFIPKNNENLEYKPTNKIGVYKVIVTIPDVNYPILPINVNENIYYPTGKIEGSWTNIELNYAYELGYKIELLEAVYYTDSDKTIFEKYMNDLYFYKNNSKGLKRNLYKSLLNNLIGRFGITLNSLKTSLMDDDQFKILSVGHNIENCVKIDNYILGDVSLNPNISLMKDNFIDPNIYINDSTYLKIKKESHMNNKYISDTSIIIPTIINAIARIKLLKLIHKLDSQGIKVYYCDTDSIVIDSLLPKDIVSDKLGDFKLENDIKEGYFISSKLYYLVNYPINNKPSIKIVNKGATRKLSKADFESLYQGKPILAVCNTTTRNLSNGSVIISDKIIELTGNYDKRLKIMHNNNWVNTKPYTYEELLKLLT